MLSRTFQTMYMARTTPNLFLASSMPFFGTVGKVASWMPGRGFGFVAGDDGKEHFVHFSAVKVEAGAFRGLTVGQEVEFDLVTQDGRTRAENVTAPGGGFLPGAPRPFNEGGRGGGEGGRGGRGGGRGYGGGRGGGRGGGGYGGRGRGGGDNNRGGDNRPPADDF